jgi:magnesium-transporting ATPase (P-type)
MQIDMENFEFKKRDIDLSKMKNNLNKIDAEFEKELSEITKEFNESGLNIIDFIVKKFNENVEKTSKNLDDLHKMSMEFNGTEGIFYKLKGLHVDLCVCNQGKICPEHNGLKVSEIPNMI